jgi:hypothetical protein
LEQFYHYASEMYEMRVSLTQEMEEEEKEEEEEKKEEKKKKKKKKKIFNYKFFREDTFINKYYYSYIYRII